MDFNQYTPMIAQAEPNKEPDGDLVAYFDNRQQLDHAMRRLAEQKFPMQTIYVVGRNITHIEYVGGELTYPRVIAAAAFQGACFGAFIGAVTAILTGTAIGAHLISSIPLGMMVWVLTGLISFSRNRQKGRGSFAMRGQTIPGTLEMRAHFSTSDRARQILRVGPYARQPGNPAGAPAPVPHNTPGGTPVHGAGWTGPQGQEQAPPAGNQESTFVGPEYNRDGSRAGGKFGLRIEDPEEYARTVRQEPVPAPSNERIEQIRKEQNQSRYGIRVDDPAELSQSIRQNPRENEESTGDKPR